MIQRPAAATAADVQKAGAISGDKSPNQLLIRIQATASGERPGERINRPEKLSGKAGNDRVPVFSLRAT